MGLEAYAAHGMICWLVLLDIVTLSLTFLHLLCTPIIVKHQGLQPSQVFHLNARLADMTSS